MGVALQVLACPVAWYVTVSPVPAQLRLLVGMLHSSFSFKQMPAQSPTVSSTLDSTTFAAQDRDDTWARRNARGRVRKRPNTAQFESGSVTPLTSWGRR